MSDKVERLIKKLEDSDLNVCNDASIELGEIGDPRAVEPLIKLVKREPRAGYFAIQALGIIGDKRAVEPLKTIAAEDEFLKSIAHDALKNIEDQDFVDAKKFFKQGVSYAESNNYDKAVECYIKALEDNPRYAEAHYNIGVAYYELGRKQDAVESYKRCLKWVEGSISNWIPFLYRAKCVINESEGVDDKQSINRLRQYLEKYRIGCNTPGGFDTSDIKDYVLCIFDVGHLKTGEARAVLEDAKAFSCSAEIAMAVDLVLSE